VQKWKPLLVDKMDHWEALAVDDYILKEFLERCNTNTTFIPGPAGHA